MNNTTPVKKGSNLTEAQAQALKVGDRVVSEDGTLYQVRTARFAAGGYDHDGDIHVEKVTGPGGRPYLNWHEAYTYVHSLDDLQAGDVLTGGLYDPYTVQGTVGDVVIVTNCNGEPKLMSVAILKRSNWQLQQPQPTDGATELTIAQIAEKFGISTEHVRIKDAD